MRALTTCGCVYRDGFRVLRHAGGAYPWRGACRLRGLETSFGGRERAASVLFLFWRRSSGECTVPNQGWMLAASPSTGWTRRMGTRFSTADRISGLPTVGRRHFPSLPSGGCGQAFARWTVVATLPLVSRLFSQVLIVLTGFAVLPQVSPQALSRHGVYTGFPVKGHFGTCPHA